MKIGLILTTINVPSVLQLYRKLGPDVHFFIAGDEKSPHDEIVNLAVELSPYEYSTNYYSPQRQIGLGYKSSEPIGWNNDSRRNIALLEALKWGAEIIVSVDDDMLPRSPNLFEQIEKILTEPYSGLLLGAAGYWFDSGGFTEPQAPQRGLPLTFSWVPSVEIVHNVQVGVWQGNIFGVPDTNALTMFTNQPIITQIYEPLASGFVVRPDCYAVFNSQFTAFRRELAPAFAQFYKWQGRNTDIFASLIMRRVMKELNLYTYYGPPMGFHARTPRDPLKDLKAEMFGLERVAKFNEWVNDYVWLNDDKNALELTADIWHGMSERILPRENIDCALLWLEDVASVL